MKKREKKRGRKILWIAISSLFAFVLWTVAISFIDVREIGQQGSKVGFATVNDFVHNIIGEHLYLYTLTDILSVLPLCFVLGYALLGLVQWIKRKSFFKVDRSILALGVFYIAVMAIYVFFEIVVVNYRPVLIDGVLEVSYPSSTTVLVICVMISAVMQTNIRIKNRMFRRCTGVLMIAFTSFMVIARLISGVHWFTDIIGGILLSIGLVMTYYYFIST